MTNNNPTLNRKPDFKRYLDNRKNQLSNHIVNGIPDYSFSLDEKLRQQLTTVPAIRNITQTLVSWSVPIVEQLHQMESIEVGPQQYSNIHKLAEDCAHRLGIAPPQIYIQDNSCYDAYTFTTDDIESIIVLSSGIVNSLKPEELKFVIGHECGHIHNLHGIYNTVIEIMTNELVEEILNTVPTNGVLNLLLQGTVTMFFKRWSRCAEITCDRAGLICCTDLNTAIGTIVKLVTGGGHSSEQINIELYREQISNNLSHPIQLIELLSPNPLIPKRIKALEYFSECETFYGWQKDRGWQTDSKTKKLKKKRDTDHLCEQVIDVM